MENALMRILRSHWPRMWSQVWKWRITSGDIKTLDTEARRPFPVPLGLHAELQHERRMKMSVLNVTPQNGGLDLAR
ncbi:unnamed protein product [Merluccius merluccius]